MLEFGWPPLRCLLLCWPLLLAVGWRQASGQQQPPPDLLTSEVVIPGTGRVQRLPHSLRPPLHETHAFHRTPRGGGGGGGGREEGEVARILPPPALARRHRRQDDRAPAPPSSPPPSAASDTKINDSSGGSAASGGPTDKAANLITSNSTQIAEGGGERRGLADKQIVIIVVCASIGLVICLLGAAFLGKFYWGKMREDGAGYQGVRQKDPSEGNSPVDEHRIIAGSHKEKDGRVLSNMFAQIDEIDEESVPGSPTPITTNKVRRQSSQQPGIALENGETKPLLNYSAAAKLSSAAATGQGRIEVNDESSCNDRANGKVDQKDIVANDESQSGVREVQVEVLNTEATIPAALLTRAAVREPEPRLYCRTGLSQSDYSISSFTSVNPSYRYGNQVGYMGGYYGYPCESGLISPDYYDDSALLLPDGSLLDDGGGSLNGIMVLLPPPLGAAPASTSSSNVDLSPSPGNELGTEPDTASELELPPPVDRDAPSPLPETRASREDADDLCSIGAADDLDDGGENNNDDDDFDAPPPEPEDVNDVTIEIGQNHRQVSSLPLRDESVDTDGSGQADTGGQAGEMTPPPPPDEDTAVTSSDGGDVTTISGGGESGGCVAPLEIA